MEKTKVHKKTNKQQQAELIASLSDYQKKLVKRIRRTRPTVYTVCTHVSASGMLRVIECFIVVDNKPVNIDLLIQALDLYNLDKKHNGLRVSGCGMDMGFSVVYNLSSTIFPDGFKFRSGEYHRNGDPSPIDKNGGYALKQSWL